MPESFLRQRSRTQDNGRDSLEILLQPGDRAGPHHVMKKIAHALG
jgi:hypothetical protein